MNRFRCFRAAVSTTRPSMRETSFPLHCHHYDLFLAFVTPHDLFVLASHIGLVYINLPVHRVVSAARNPLHHFLLKQPAGLFNNRLAQLINLSSEHLTQSLVCLLPLWNKIGRASCRERVDMKSVVLGIK